MVSLSVSSINLLIITALRIIIQIIFCFGCLEGAIHVSLCVFLLSRKVMGSESVLRQILLDLVFGKGGKSSII